jgi:hypothetical protein
MEHSAGSVIVPIKSPSDDREYRYVILKNGLHALLVSDPETDKAAAACDVNVGSMCDPSNLLGLAHFLGTNSLIQPHRIGPTSSVAPDLFSTEKKISSVKVFRTSICLFPFSFWRFEMHFLFRTCSCCSAL